MLYVRWFVRLTMRMLHVSGRVNPLDDIEVINMELVLADLESVEKRLPK